MTSEQHFRDLLAHAWAQSPFYRRIYVEHGIQERDLPHVPLEDLPVVSKAEVMEHWDEAVTDPRLRFAPLKLWLERDSNPQSLYLDEYVVMHSSGGSSIRSVIPWTLKTWRLMTAVAAPDILPMNPETRAPLRSAFYFAAAGHFVSDTSTRLASQATHRILSLYMRDPLEEVWAKLNAFKPEHLSTYASLAAWLAGWTLEGRLRIRPSSLLVSGDRLTPHARSMISEAWGSNVYDLYAACESLYMAVRKPGRDDYLVFTDLNVLEVVNGSRRMVQPGERGRVLMTNLVNRTLPLIRFDLFDEAILGKAGFGAETLKKIDGKAHVRLPVRLANGAVGELPVHDLHTLRVPRCGKMQFVSHSPDEIEIRYEADQNLDSQVKTAFEALLAARSGKVLSVYARRVEYIPNDQKTHKALEVLPAGRPSVSWVRLSNSSVAPQGSPRALRETRPVSAAPRSLFGRFQEISNRYPTRVAVTDGEQQLTYQQCSWGAHQIARGLLQRGFDSRRPVAVLCGHRLEMIPLLLGVIAAGGFYLALDPYVTRERLRTIIREAHCEYILTATAEEHLVRGLAGAGTTVLQLEDLVSAQPPELPLPEVASGAPACLLYTSGSTGNPKGVLLSHETVLHRVWRYTEDFHLCPDDRLSLLQSFAVSAGVRDVFGALLNGATLVVYDIRSRGIAALPGWLNQNRISVFYAVPTVWRLLLEVLADETFPWLRMVRLGGEPVQPRDLEGFKLHFAKGCRLVNGYAATETGSICQYFMDHQTHILADRVPVGVAVPGSSIEILDETGQTVTGEVGEIAIEAASLALGYWDPRGRQAVPLRHPFATGDLGYQLPDGRVFLTSRRDSIVNLYGYRINLGEIEKAISAVAGVKEAAAASQTTPSGDTTIAVYYVPESGNELSSARLRRTLASILPSPAVSISYMPVTGLPRLPGGKVNRNELPRPEPVQVPPTGNQVSYQSQTEARLAQIWKDVLAIQVIPAKADFFNLGGDSITALRVLSRVSASFHVQPSIREFLSHSTLSQLARVIDELVTG